LLSARKLAKKLGKKTYHGRACKNCGSTEKDVNTSTCLFCKKEIDKKSKRKNRYNLSEIDYQKMLKKQKNNCGICGKPKCKLKSLSVDHDHKTGVVRGLLCFKCNFALGLFQDSPKILKKAIRYLK
jgi:hypothetical protein